LRFARMPDAITGPAIIDWSHILQVSR